MNAHPTAISPGDVVRGRRAGTKTDQNFVVDRTIRSQETVPDVVTFWGHTEYRDRGNNPAFITVYNPRIIRTYGGR